MTTAVQTIALDKIELSKTNPRRVLNGPALDELTASVRAHGVLQPILVRPRGEAFEVVAGHRRHTAATKAGLEEIPALVRELSDQETLEIQVIENLERKDLHPLEEAAGYQRLMREHGYKVERLAERIHKSVKYIYDRVKLLQLTKEVQKLFLEDRITSGHAILLARLSPKDQARVALPDRDDPRDARGLWEEEHTLFDNEDDARAEKDPLAGMKAVSVRELQSWIDEHVRFDAKDPDPMLFPAAAEELAGAKKVIPITHSHYIPPEAREGRTYGPRSWKRADGEMETDRYGGRTRKSKTCEYSVTGFVAIGPDRGEAFAVCVNKDKCATHWPEHVKAKKSRAAGKSPSPKQNAEAEKKRHEREQKARERQRLVFDTALPKLAAAFAAVIQKASVAGLVEMIRPDAPDDQLSGFVPRGKTAEDALRWIAWCDIARELDNSYWTERLAKRLGVNYKPILEAATAEVAAAEKKAAATEKPSKSGSGKTRAKARKKK